MIRRALRDPLAHFLIAGAAIWGGLALLGEPVDPASRTIELSRERQEGIALGFERMMGRPPTDAEMDAAVERWVREEVLYREALRLGLDDGDAVVRRRLATKMDELAGAEAEIARPSDEALETWLAARPEAYRTGGMTSFEQVYFASEGAARAALGTTGPQGEAISLPASMSKASSREIAERFGQQFADALADLSPSDALQGPVESGFGWHLVRVTEREDGALPPLEDIRERVEADWRGATISERRERAYALLREAYTVEVE
ncbi:peptidylprolyl isomerase [Qipengyuania flava]|uniref:peptidylprolyl isomerase n=1 Tax=Qipengyuania flava TaxID=192812 RepID=UPI001C62CA21|nr:peptidylprolyl isomerase [Qipengyuania flava]QYJ07682.1 peptidyl-prolyl cis-trans isomerase [Qipengyuania flava]